MALQFSGYAVQIAENGHEALSLFEPKKFVLIFTDFEMPGMKGHEFASIIKARDPNQPIILVTAHGDMVGSMEPLPQVDMVLCKPCSLDDLRTAISKVLSIS